MWSSYRRPIAITRLAMVTLTALTIATPATAQFGGLKKKLKEKAGQEDASRPAGAEAEASEEAADQGAPGGTIVLTTDVVNQLLTGLKAAQDERAAAAREDTPYGRYLKAEIAYAEAQTKCDEAQRRFLSGTANKELSDKSNAFTEKAIAAGNKGDTKLMAIYQDSAQALKDPSCIVKKPEQPADSYKGEREVEIRVEQAEVKASGLSGGELAMVKERTDAILRGGPGADISASEKSAVSAKATELRPLMGIEEPQPAAQAAIPAPAPAPTAPAPAPAPDPQMSAAASSMSACMAKNMQKDQARIEALAKRGQAAQKAKDNATLMAIADTIQRIQMAGCQGR
jgi:hypothetical protein